MKSKVLDVMKVVFVIIFLFLLIAEHAEAAGEAEIVKETEKVLVFGRTSDYRMDPAVVGDTESLYTVFTVYDQLVTRDKNLEIKPLLATSWEISEDYTVYTFNLRKGVKFHDGNPFNAEAVKFSFDRMTAIGKFSSGGWMRIADENSVEVVDDYTVKIHLTKPFPNWIPADLSINPGYAIMSPTYVKKNMTNDDPYAEKWMAYHECGTGPWKLVSWTKGQKIVFEKNEDYFGGDEGISDRRIPRADKLIFQVFRDSTTGRLWLERGDIDFVIKLSSDDFIAVEKDPNIMIHEEIPAGIVYLTYDVSKPPFNDKNVRKAIAYAIDYKELIEYVERGHGKLPRGMITEGTFGYNLDGIQYDLDLEKAKEFMSKSSYSEGFTTKLLYSPERRATFRKAAIFIQSYLKKIGIDALPESLAFPTQLAICSEGNYGIALRDWIPFYPDPSETAGWFYNIRVDDSGWICSFWDNEEAIHNMEFAETLPTSPERYKLYAETEKNAISQAIYIPLCQTAQLLAARNNLKNIDWNLNLGIRAELIYKDEWN